MSVTVSWSYTSRQLPLLSMPCDDMEEPRCEEGEAHSEHNYRQARSLLVKMDVQSKLGHICVPRCKDLPAPWPTLVKSVVSVLHLGVISPGLNLSHAVLLLPLLLCKTPCCEQSPEDKFLMWDISRPGRWTSPSPCHTSLVLLCPARALCWWLLVPTAGSSRAVALLGWQKSCVCHSSSLVAVLEPAGETSLHFSSQKPQLQ